MGNYLGIEFGSTRIKAVVIDEKYNVIDSASYTWKSDFINGIWTYDLKEALQGLKYVIKNLKVTQNIKSIGISGMMHGYLPFDKDWNLLAPFRTWQNTITEESASKLTELFNFNVPQRWSIAHLYQAILNNEDHINNIAHITTLSGYIHYMLTGVNAVGICEASGIFPIDSENLCYDKAMIEKFNKLIPDIDWKLEDVLPEVLTAGENAGHLTKSGAELIDNILTDPIPFAPPEGDGGTGMVATNSVSVKTGNVSAGTSIFAMVVLEKNIENVYEEIDIVTTPVGKPVAMIHCNNCTNDSNAWVSVLKETAELFGADVNPEKLYTLLYEKSLEGDNDCGGVIVCNYMSGEVLTGLNEGRPLVLRNPDSKFTLANFFRSTLYSTMATLRLGMDVLTNENIKVESLTGHGGLFKTPVVAQKYMASALNVPVTVMQNAGEGGAYGMALLSAYQNDNLGFSLEDYLNMQVFNSVIKTTEIPEKEIADGFNSYIEKYKQMLKVEKTAVEVL